jgi:type I restriction enzyme M protein
LIENGLVEAILILPRNLFYSTDISVTLWILNANKKARTALRNGETVNYRDREREVLFIDLRQMGEPFEKKYVRLTDEDIAQVTNTYHSWQVEGYENTYRNTPEYCYSASVEEIANKGYSLVPSKFIEFANRDETVDYETRMKQLQTELSDILKQEANSRKDLMDVFKTLGYELDV